MLKPLSTNQEVLGSVPGSAFKYFSSGELFHDMYGLDVSVVQFPLSMFCPVLSSKDIPELCEGSIIVSLFLYVVHRRNSLESL